MTEFNIATFNLRNDNLRPGHSPNDGPNAWPHRREWVRDLIAFHGFDIVGVQEAFHHQLTYLAEGNGMAYVGVGRDDGREEGEYAAILYRPERFAPSESGTFWLSETPETPSAGWDARLHRVCTWARLSDRETGRAFCVFNTHFDHEGARARAESAELTLRRVGEIAGDGPVFLTGDFNLSPDAAPIRRLATSLRDARDVSETRPYGPSGTFQGFDVSRNVDTRDACIDYVFVGGPVRVRRHGTLPDNWGGRYPSDHLPVAVRAEVTGQA